MIRNLAPLALALLWPLFVQGAAHKFVFDGAVSTHRLTLAQLGEGQPADWSDQRFLVLEMRASTPQRFSLWIDTEDGERRVMIQPLGQGVWLRAAIPLQYFQGPDAAGHDLASVTNRRTASFWMSVWGPFGDLKRVRAIEFSMLHPIGQPKLELRSVSLAREDPGSDFLEGKPVLDEFGQWRHADWPRKIRSQKQLESELAAEAAQRNGGDFGYNEFGGYASRKVQGTGFFRVEQVEGRWWFVDPHGHLFLSTGSNGMHFWRDPTAHEERSRARLIDWGLTTGPEEYGFPYMVMLQVPRDETTFLGMPDVYSEKFARRVDLVAAATCAPRRNDPRLIGYFCGNEPPWCGRESEVVDRILAGPDTETRRTLRDWLAAGDTGARREEFVLEAFKHYLRVIDAAIRRHDPNHLTLGLRFGGIDWMPDNVIAAGGIFDVCSINVYEYEPTRQVERAHRLTGRPILIGEFHIGSPGNGLGAGLVQARDQTERGKGYRYYVEQAAACPSFVGAHWFQWRDQPVLGRRDGENYNIGLVDVTDRAQPEMAEALRATSRRLLAVHSGATPPFDQRPLASDAGTPTSPWIERDARTVAGGESQPDARPSIPPQGKRDERSVNKPNIIVILSDDVGYGDLGSYGATRLRTPNLDRLAAEGLRFTDAYAPAACCSPTRYALLTGEYAWRRDAAGLNNRVANGDSPLLIPSDLPALPAIMKQAGYRTGAVGKWHLGFGLGRPDYNRDLKPGPLEIGFDEFFGFPSTNDRVPTVYMRGHRVVDLDPRDPIDYSYDEAEANTRGLSREAAGRRRIGWTAGGRSAWWKDDDIADTLTREAVGFIDRNKDEPFFLYFATHDAHAPQIPHPRFAGTTGLGARADMLSELDWTVGEVLKALDRLGLADTTLIVFSSDNGGYRINEDGHRPNGILRGVKSQLWEGGNRVPLIVRWPGHIKPGVSGELASLVDLPATFAALTGVRLQQGAAPDSRDLLPVWQGRTDVHPRDHVIIQSGLGDVAIRQGPWKLIPDLRVVNGWDTNPEKAAVGSVEPGLYNLVEDPGETRNVYAMQAEVAARLSKTLKTIVGGRVGLTVTRDYATAAPRAPE